MALSPFRRTSAQQNHLKAPKRKHQKEKEKSMDVITKREMADCGDWGLQAFKDSVRAMALSNAN
ncbi:hypothetical protein CCACVL1_30044 [Corchorus capsularis]|uniref:Uncharacterized protein n=1 Tax=Corchorus capsularis TaxID=210143 RepID=A0A1R3FYX1_COCAP|nr:hypothetical protein CCACVL1_30044 [Corchorus capsularis]